MTTPCRENPEAWVGDDANLRAEAAKECARCPLNMFTACQKLAKIEPFGVMAGRDYGTHLKTIKERTVPAEPPLPEDVKECEACGVTVTRGKRSRSDWAKLRFCSKKCYASTRIIHGLPVVKVCERCGAEFGRDGRSPAHWRQVRFCGVGCANVKKPRERAA